jgi:hypothetical protein
MAVDIYTWFDHFAPFIVFWIACCTVITTVRLILKFIRGQTVVGPSSFMTELPAFPIIFFQTACFFKFLIAGDIFSSLLFLWWGIGFWATVVYLIVCKKTGRKQNWYPYRKIISWLCKINYVAFIGVFFFMDVPALIFVYSAWIINDQYGMAFLSLDADRLRRTFHDYWLVRVLYPLGLGVPYVWSAIPYSGFYKIYGATLFILWVAGIIYVRKRADLMKVPNDPTLLRNMVYFAKPLDPS